MLLVIAYFFNKSIYLAMLNSLILRRHNNFDIAWFDNNFIRQIFFDNFINLVYEIGLTLFDINFMIDKGMLYCFLHDTIIVHFKEYRPLFWKMNYFALIFCILNHNSTVFIFPFYIRYTKDKALFRPRSNVKFIIIGNHLHYAYVIFGVVNNNTLIAKDNCFAKDIAWFTDFEQWYLYVNDSKKTIAPSFVDPINNYPRLRRS